MDIISEGSRLGLYILKKLSNCMVGKFGLNQKEGIKVRLSTSHCQYYKNTKTPIKNHLQFPFYALTKV
jgi:hypothetical protein